MISDRTFAMGGGTAASLAYATLRDNVLRGVPWSDWPVFVLNKALALSSLLLYGYSNWLTPSSWPGYLPPITLVSFAAGLIGLLAALRGPSSPPVSR